MLLYRVLAKKVESIWDFTMGISQYWTSQLGFWCTAVWTTVDTCTEKGGNVHVVSPDKYRNFVAAPDHTLTGRLKMFWSCFQGVS